MVKNHNVKYLANYDEIKELKTMLAAKRGGLHTFRTHTYNSRYLVLLLFFMGLLLLLHQGDEVAGVNRERIKILRRSGKVNYFHRRLDRQMKVDLLYELTVTR